MEDLLDVLVNTESLEAGVLAADGASPSRGLLLELQEGRGIKALVVRTHIRPARQIDADV